MTTPAAPQTSQPAGSQSPTTSVTPPNPPTETEEQKAIRELKAKEALYMETIREQGAKLNELSAKVESLPTTVTPEPTQQERANKFYSDPEAAINAAIEKAIAPLKNFVTTFKSESAYDRLKNKFKADPRFKETIEKYEPFIDQAMAKNEPNDNNMIGVLSGIVGAATLGLLATPSAPAPTTTSAANNGEPTTVITPPHIRPTPSATPRPQDDKPKRRQLTENEKRLAREKGMSEEVFHQWLEADKEDVATSRIGLPEKK